MITELSLIMAVTVIHCDSCLPARPVSFRWPGPGPGARLYVTGLGSLRVIIGLGQPDRRARPARTSP